MPTSFFAIDTFNNTSLVQKGTGAATGPLSAVVTVNTTAAGNVDTGETDLWSYSLPANTLSADSKLVRVIAFGSFAANGNTKTLKLYFAGTVINSRVTTTSGGGWQIFGYVIRTGASTQIAFGDSAGTGGLYATPAGDTTAAIIIKMSGQSGTASNDVLFKGAFVEALN